MLYSSSLSGLKRTIWHTEVRETLNKGSEMLNFDYKVFKSSEKYLFYSIFCSMNCYIFLDLFF